MGPCRRDRLEDHITCAAAPGDRVVRRRLPDFCLSRSNPDEPSDKFGEKSCPAAFGCSGYGAAMFELQPQPGQPRAPFETILHRGRGVKIITSPLGAELGQDELTKCGTRVWIEQALMVCSLSDACGRDRM